MIYAKILHVDSHTAEQMQQLCDRAHSDVRKEGCEFDEEVTFEDGCRMSIQVCGPNDPSQESCWVQGVLYDADGTELDCTEVNDRFLDVHTICHGVHEYRCLVQVREEVEPDDSLTEEYAKLALEGANTVAKLIANTVWAYGAWDRGHETQLAEAMKSVKDQLLLLVPDLDAAIDAALD